MSWILQLSSSFVDERCADASPSKIGQYTNSCNLTMGTVHQVGDTEAFIVEIMHSIFCAQKLR